MNREELLNECKELVTVHRISQYGTPEDNHGKIAAMWSVYLGMEIKDYDVANMMILLKVVRVQALPQKTDSWVDIAGYAACGCEVATKKEENKADHKDVIIKAANVLDHNMNIHLQCTRMYDDIRCDLALGHPGKCEFRQ